MHSTVSKMMKGMTKTVREKRIVHTSVQDLSMIGSRTFSLSLGPEPYLQPPWTKGNRIVEADRGGTVSSCAETVKKSVTCRKGSAIWARRTRVAGCKLEVMG